MSNNLRGLLIKETIWLNTLRSICAGIVWMIISFFKPNDENIPFYLKFIYPIIFPLVLLLLHGVAQILKLFKMGGVGNFMCMFATVPGDPLLYLLFRLKPEIVPVKSLNIMNFVGIFLVYRDNIPMPKDSSFSGDKLICPFAGHIIADREVNVFGFTWPIEATIFTITNDWKITSNNVSFGWVDKTGQIRQGLKGDPEATLSPGEIIGKIINNRLYVNNEKIGDLVKF